MCVVVVLCVCVIVVVCLVYIGLLYTMMVFVIEVGLGGWVRCSRGRLVTAGGFQELCVGVGGCVSGCVCVCGSVCGCECVCVCVCVCAFSCLSVRVREGVSSGSTASA